MAGQRARQDELDAYRAKRRFDQTPEPRGRAARKAGRLYTIQKHAARRLHYDLRLELDGVLKTWAVTKGPSLDPADKRLAVRSEDHPVDYATFEGRIPEGNYGAGTVLLWDKGEWEPIGDPHAGLAEGKLEFRLRGERLKGRWALVRFHGQRDPKRENLLLIKEKDELAAHGRAVTERATTSVASGRDIDAIAAKPDAVWESKGAVSKCKRQASSTKPARHPARHDGKLPAFSAPALATMVDALPEGPDWLFEVKFDGYRALAAASGDHVRIYTRNGKDWTDRYPAIARAIAVLKLDRALLDGEVVATDRAGRSDFGALQQALSEGRGGLIYFVFDLLELGGNDLRRETLTKRKEWLRKLLAGVPRSGPVAYTDHVIGDGREMYRTLCDKAFEGMIAKRATAPYRPGRTASWLKIKCRHEQEFVIVGWSSSSAERPFASILLAQHVNGRLRYAGRVGSGFSGRALSDLAERFKGLARRAAPLNESLPLSLTRGVHWLRPELVAEIAFAEFTSDGIVRQGRFVGLREDKVANDVRQEKPMPVRKVVQHVENDASVGGVRLTHPDKILYPAQKLTKRDVALYLEAASGRLLPHLADRPLSLLRCPDGVAKQGFFQRHAGAGLPKAIRRVPVIDKDGKQVEYLYIADKAGLLAAAQFDVLEFHIWGVHVDDVDRPDRIVFDLDPDPAIGFPTVREAADHVRAALDALGLASFAMLTGGKGVHVVAPITRRHPWPIVKEFARALAERFATEVPELYVATMSRARRTGRIFIDHFRNERTASAIAPYSPRGRPGAAVAWPVTWRELASFTSADEVSLATATQRSAEPDPWDNYNTAKQSLTAAALRSLGVAA
jgi:bifunctional non-homologous end joining protein LigD